MRRLLAVVFSGVLLSGVLLADDKCPQPPSPPEPCPPIGADGCPTPVKNKVCTVPLDYFNTYQGCTGTHKPIQIAVGDFLLITNGNGSSIKNKFSVGSFTAYEDSDSDDCDQSDILGVAAPFDETANIGSLKSAHTLQAKQPGCYKVNLILNQKEPNPPHRPCLIDPHIIIKGTSPVARHQKKK